ncbi:membrane protein [Streptomyces spiroverticillatus]|uniref:Membrane protein n=1 Tax=Streptomyces finlayi TaxID=67296 RepID=A0A918WY06_9ACTN|nr:DMT family transporter [Streptomyces finlayi]GHA11874.1 membrane protein [Streptomyces spiroverticillatus]GHC94760.1 membrane protein [Streptomyces finlayi]
MAVIDRVPGGTGTSTGTGASATGTGASTTSTGTGATVRKSAGLGLLLAAVATVVWSGSFVTSRGLHDSVPPVQAAFWRWIVALLAVAPFAVRETWRQRAVLRQHLGFVTLAALLGVTVYNTLVNQAGLDTPAGTMGMIMAASPVVMAVYERLGGHRLGARRVTGMLIACVGVLLLVSKGSLGLGLSAGAFWMTAAALCFGSYSALLRRKPAGIGGLAFLFSTFVLGALMLAPVYGVSLAVQGGFEVRATTVGPLVYVGVFSSAVAFFAWNKAISLVGAARAGIVYYLQPVCVALLSYAVLGERTGPLQVLCMALILGGVVLGASTGRPARATAPAAPKKAG